MTIPSSGSRPGRNGMRMIISGTVNPLGRIRPTWVSSRSSNSWRTGKGRDRTIGGRTNWERTRNEMSGFRMEPNRYWNRGNPEAVMLPSTTAVAEEEIAAVKE